MKKPRGVGAPQGKEKWLDMLIIAYEMGIVK